MKAIIFILAFLNIWMVFLQRQYSFEIAVIAATAFFYAIGIFTVAEKNDKLEKQIKELQDKIQ